MSQFSIPTAGETIDHYLLVEEIGRGGMAVIFKAIDQRNQRDVALKILSRTEKEHEFQARFHREFKALSNLNHPNVLRVFDNGDVEGQPYFTMEYLQGKTLKEIIPSWLQLSPTDRFSKAQKILFQMAKALDYIHRLGWVHRDITPSNIMIAPDDSVKLMDFGVVKIPGTELTIVGEVIGTVAYMSPEQIRNDAVDSRADLYSLGACLYLMLTGERPFRSRTLSGFLKKHLKEKPQPPSSYFPMIPTSIETACLRLLEKEPKNRFASANHLLQYLNTQNTKQNVPTLIGRTKELHQIREKLAALSLKKGGVIILEAPSGLGKSQLLHSTGNVIDNLGIFWSLCKNHSTKQPIYTGFQALFEQIKKSSKNAQIQIDSPETDQWVLFAQIQEQLQVNLPMVILMDNIELADSGTLALLKFLILSMTEMELPILFLLSWNPNFVATPTLQEIFSLDIVEKILLSPLTEEAVEEWLLCLAKNDTNLPLLSKRLHQEGEGSPFFIDELLRELIRKGIIVETHRDFLSIETNAISSLPLPMPESIRDMAIERVKNLDSRYISIIELLSLARQELSIKTLSNAFDYLSIQLHPYELNQAVTALIKQDLLFGRDVEGQHFVELSHLWFKDIIIQGLSTEQRIQYHYALGMAHEFNYYQQNIGSIVETLAYHFEQANRAGKGYAYLILAAQKLKNRSLFHEALNYLDRAILIEPKARQHLILQEAETRLAELYLDYSGIAQKLGNWEQAKAKANLADQLAGDQHNIVLLSKIASEKACQARECYDLAQADLQIKRALRYAEESGQLHLQILPLYEQGALYWEKSQTEKAEASFQKALSLSERFNDQYGIAKVNNGLGVLSMCLGNSPTARKSFEQSIASSKQLQRIEEMVVAQTNLAELHHCMGNFKKGLELINSAIQRCRQIHYRVGLGISLRYSAILLTDIARYAEAEEHAKLALSVNTELHSTQESLASLVVLIRIYMTTRNWRKLSQYLPKALALAENYDAEGYLPILLSWKARLIIHQDDDIPQAISVLKYAIHNLKRHWRHQEVRCYLNIARAWLACEDKEEAIAFAQIALSISNTSGYRHYAMRARQILAKIIPNPMEKARHERVAKALCRSLAASLDSKNKALFEERHTT